MDNTRPPVVSTRPSVVPIFERVTLSSLITVTDFDNDSTVTRYRFRDNSAGAGNFLRGNQSLAANTWHEVSSGQFPTVTYRGGPSFAKETYSVQVYDGKFWSNVATTSITTGNETPVISASPGRVGERERVRVSQFFQVNDADNDPAIRYLFVDRRNNADGGRFVDINGPKLQASWFIVEAGDLPTLFYEGAVAGREVENIGVQVWDGYSWSETVEFEMATTTQPTIVPTAETILVDQRRSAVAFFQTVDADGDKIFSYSVNDYSTNSTSGYWEFKGARMPAGQFFSVLAADLGKLFFVGASVGPQIDNIGVQVYDGFQFSDIERLSIRTVTPPEVSGRFTEVQAGHYINVATGRTKNEINGVLSATGTPLLDFADADGDLVDSFLFNDKSVNSNGGYFVFKGTRIASGQFFQVSAGELNQLFYRGGEFGPQGENIQVLAHSTGIWSDTATFRINTLENRFAPELNLFNATAKAGVVLQVSGLFTWSDLDGDAIQSFSFFDTGVDVQSGFFSVNGIRQPAGVRISLDWDELSTVNYHLSSIANTENVQLSLFDGRKTSLVKTATITSVVAPVIDATDNDLSVNTIERVPVSSLVRKIDAGPSFTQYQVLDENDFFRSGRLELDGNDLQQGVVHTLNAAEFSRLVFKGAETDFGRQLDPYIVRADNGITGWSEWERFNVNTDPVGGLSLRSGFQVDKKNAGPKTVITYSFIDGGNQGGTGTRENPSYPPTPSYIPPGGSCDTGNWETLGTLAFSQQQREGFREVFADYEKFANVDFVEVEYTLAAADAEIVIGTWGPFDCLGASAYAFLPSSGNGLGNDQSDIWFNVANGDFDPRTPTDVSLGSFFRYTASHELGHAIGMKHPFEGSPFLSIFNNFDYNTVMAYNHDSVDNKFEPYVDPDNGVDDYPSSPMLYDIGEVQRLYGVNSAYNSNNNHYGNGFSGSYPHFISATEQHQTTLWDGGGVDTINYTNHVGLRVIAGLIDIDGDGVISAADNGTIRARLGTSGVNSFVSVIGGFVDIDGDTAINPADDGVINRINVIDGALDINGVGGVTIADNGFLPIDETIDLREGTWSTVNGVDQTLRVAYGTVIENARGGSGDDNLRGNEIRNLLFGNAGNDVLRGGGDNDVLRGGAGNDTYIWSLGDGRDNIREEGKGGIDMVQFFDPAGSIDSLEDDFTVRRFGSELRIDLTLDQGAGQGTVSIVNFQDPNSSVELMRIHGLLGAQVGNDIDLISLFNIATSSPTQYKVTDQIGLNGGYIAAPLT